MSKTGTEAPYGTAEEEDLGPACSLCLDCQAGGVLEPTLTETSCWRPVLTPSSAISLVVWYGLRWQYLHHGDQQPLHISVLVLRKPVVKHQGRKLLSHTWTDHAINRKGLDVFPVGWKQRAGAYHRLEKPKQPVVIRVTDRTGWHHQRAWLLREHQLDGTFGWSCPTGLPKRQRSHRKARSKCWISGGCGRTLW